MRKARAITVAGCQIDQTLGDRKANLETAEAMIRSSPGHDIYVLPELSGPGYGEAVLRNLADFAETWEGPSFRAFAALATELGCHICYGFPRRCSGGEFTIAAAVVGPAGQLVARYDKWHVCSTGSCPERDFFVDGTRPLEVFEVGGIRVGICICYDLRFPELIRQLAVRRGVSLVLHPCAFPRGEGFHTWHTFAITRAVENTVYLMSTNWAGENNGHSIFSPPYVDGEQARPEKLDSGPDVLVGEVDPDRLAAVRSAFTVLADRNRRMYAEAPPG